MKQRDTNFLSVNKLFNFRLLPLLFIYFASGILCVYPSLLLRILIIAAVVLLTAMLCVHKVLGKILVFVCFLFSIGYLSAAYVIDTYNAGGIAEGTCTVTCRVSSFNSDTGMIIADDIESDGRNYRYRMNVRAQGADLTAGDIISVTGNITRNDIDFFDDYSISNYRKKIKYVMSAEDIEIISKGQVKFNEKVLAEVKDVLYRAQGKRAGAFCFALLFGDSSYMQYNDVVAMRTVGLAHIFAVSGLNIGVLSMVIVLLMKKLKVKRHWIIVAVGVVMAIYAWLSSFSPSVIRAALMAVVCLFAGALGRRNDDISVLSLTALMILFVKPLYLFDVSFILSYAAVFGMCSLISPVSKWFIGLHIPKKVAGALAISVSSSIVLFPIMCIYFGNFAVISTLANLFIVPVISVVFISVLALIPICSVFSFMSFGLQWAGSAVNFIANLSGEVSSYDWVNCSVTFPKICILPYYAAVLVMGKYCLLSRWEKLACVSYLLVTVFALWVLKWSALL